MVSTINNSHYQIKYNDSELGLIKGYASVFNIEDEGGDIIKPGAYKNTLKECKARIDAGKSVFLMPLLYQHDPGQPVGGVYEAIEDDYGLLFKAQLLLTTPRGREVFELLKAGMINQFSIGYTVAPRGCCWEKSTRIITEVALWEISAVTFAMNTEALLQDVKRTSLLSCL